MSARIPRFRWMLLGLILLVVFGMADGAATHFLVRGGLGQEGNPFLATIVGENTFLILKSVGVLLCALILWDVYRRNPRVGLVATSCFAGIYGVIVVWNVSLFFWP